MIPGFYFEQEMVLELQAIGKSLAGLPKNETLHAINDALRPYQFGKGVWPEAAMIIWDGLKAERKRIRSEATQ